ncbi:hypothetical protein ABH941_005955 [Streptacidiphilus sp. EB103A]
MVLAEASAVFATDTAVLGVSLAGDRLCGPRPSTVTAAR